MDDLPGDLLRPAQVCRMLGVSRSWLYAAAQSGRIPCVRLGGPDGPLRFVPGDIATWIEEARAAWAPGRTSGQILDRAARFRR
ncbi:MAG: helix-turn-helix transcriptional regulator [Solirubrobacteraceae bacterium]